ncbi:MAG: helix-turn-helix domain-containing protein [Planctomycetes bacterium]|nr:helix-turn-helix domain-containing protein [Planctomycetota bacterium]MBM4079658.1 helix-turn-helix domain-containing protein [Planctomycetota bacterium]MBM4086024.1 helix-turn-helix domain-containing protein [Planctomycetota bacterium]
MSPKRQLTRSEKLERRLAAGRLLLEGKLSQAEIGRQMGVTREAIRQWANKLREGGLASLGVSSYRPPASRLTPEDWQRLRDIVEKGPRAAGFQKDCWTWSDVRLLLKRMFGLRYGVRTIARLLRKQDLHLPIAPRRKSKLHLPWEQRRKVLALLAKGPRAFGLDTAKWRLADLQPVVQREVGVRCHRRYLAMALRRLSKHPRTTWTRGAPEESQRVGKVRRPHTPPAQNLSPLLAPEQWQHLLGILAWGPEAAGFYRKRWTWLDVRQLVFREFGVRCSLGYLIRHLKALNWSPGTQVRHDPPTQANPRCPNTPS